MNEVAEQKIYELLGDALDLDEGDEQVSLIENAIRLADIEGDLETQYLAREQLMRACIFGGVTEKALVAFSWCLAQFDQNPGKFSEWAILWKYKWILGLICNFPQVSKTQICKMQDDFAERSQRGGYGPRAAQMHRYRSERFWDNKEKAIEYFRKMEEAPRDELANCSACELDDRVTFSVYRGNDERALELAQPLLDGKQQCGTVPHRTYANILLPLIRLGRLPEARQYHLKGYEMIAGNKSFLDKVAEHLMFLSLTGNYARAIEVFEKHFPWMEKNRDAFYHFRFSRAAWFMFEMLAEQPNESLAEPQLCLPRSFPLYSERGRYGAARLAAWFKQKADELALRFDQRNETDFFMRTIAETPSLRALRRPLAIGGSES